MSHSQERGPADTLLRALRRSSADTSQGTQPQADSSSSSSAQPTLTPSSYASTLPSIGHESRKEIGLTALKEVLGVIRDTSDWMPILKSAAAGLLLVLERFEVRLQLFHNLLFPCY